MARKNSTAAESNVGSWAEITDDIANDTVVVIGSDKDDYIKPVEGEEVSKS